MSKNQSALPERIGDKIRLLSAVEGGRELEKRIRTFCEDPENRNGRGVKTCAIDLVCKLLDHLSTCDQQSKSNPDPQIRQQAAKVLRGVRAQSLEQLLPATSRMRGAINKAGRRRNIEKARARAACFELGNDHTLRQVMTSECLTSVGKSLDLCVAHPKGLGEGYHRALRAGTSQFFTLEKGEKPYALLTINAKSREIREMEARGGKTPKRMTLKLALAILNHLDANADDCEAFTGLGAFACFRGGRPKASPISTSAGVLKIWRTGTAAIVSVRRPDRTRLHWNKYRLEDDGLNESWGSRHALTVDELANIMLRDRVAAMKIRYALGF